MLRPFNICFLLLLLYFSTGCTALHYAKIPKQNNYKIFPQRKMENADTVFYFHKPLKDCGLGKKISVTNKDFNPTDVTLDSLTQLHKTISFVIIRNDTLVYEKYKEDLDTISVSSFSIAKPFISTLVGIAIDEGHIKSIDDKITDYLPEFRYKPLWNEISIRDLLHHTSGIKFNKLDNIKFYWSTDLRKQISHLTLEHSKTKHFNYSSANTLLLGLILEKTTGSTVSQYLEKKIWKPLGTEAPLYWSLDRSDSLALEKTFCCLQGRTLDFAKLARLYLNGGKWNNQQIVSKEWVDYSTHPDPINGNRHFYNNNWGIGPLNYGSFYAIGLYGQFLYVYPKKNIIIVRFGDAELNYHPNYWLNIFLQIIDQL